MIYESLVDRGANGGLAGSDVRILSQSPRKCIVNHDAMQDLDIVQSAVLVNSNHGIVDLIMNKYMRTLTRCIEKEGWPAFLSSRPRDSSNDATIKQSNR